MNATSSMVPFASSTGSNSSSAVSISSKAGPFNKHMQGSMLVDFTEEDDDDINEVARATEEIYDQINLLQKRERQKERELQKAEAIRGLLREDIKQAQNDIRDIKQKVAAMGMTLNRLQIEEKDLREQILAKIGILPQIEILLQQCCPRAQMKFKNLKTKLLNLVPRVKSALKSLDAEEGKVLLEKFILRK